MSPTGNEQHIVPGHGKSASKVSADGPGAHYENPQACPPGCVTDRVPTEGRRLLQELDQYVLVPGVGRVDHSVDGVFVMPLELSGFLGLP